MTRSMLAPPAIVLRTVRAGLTLALVALYASCTASDEPQLELVDGRIAVLPFTSADGDATLDEIAVAIEESAASAVAGVQGAELVRLGMAGDVDVDDPLRSIAAQTGATMILRGIVLRIGDEVEIQAEIVDPTDESRAHRLPAERAPAADAPTAVVRLASRVAGAVAVHLDPDWASPWLYSVPTVEAYRIADRADSLFTRTLQEEAIPVFYEAYEADTMYLNPLFTAAAAHRNLGRGVIGDSLLDFIEERSDLLTDIERYSLTWFRGPPEDALRAARAARELDPLGWTYGVGLRANQAGHFTEAAEALSHREELVALGSDNARNWPAWRGQYMTALHAIGDHETELAVAMTAREDFTDDPWWIWNEMRARAALRQVAMVRTLYDSATIILASNPNPSHYENLEDIAVELKVHGEAEAGDELLELVIEHYRQGNNAAQLADALGFAGRTQEAYEALEPVIAEAEVPDVLGWFGVAAAITGRTDRAEEMLARLEGLPSASTGNSLRYQAALHGALGRCDRAIELYRQSFQAGFAYSQAWGGEWWHRDWETAPVRENCPQFQSLLDVIRT